MFDKTSKVFIFNLLFLYHVICIDVTFYFLVHCTSLDFQHDDRPPSWIFIFSQYLSKIQIVPISTSTWWRSDTSYCVFLIFKMAAVRHIAILDLVWRHSGPPTTSIWLS